MNGKIALESEVGQGSTFTVTLPFDTSHVAETEVAEQKGAS
jgi:signal transduction histidine kinase